MLTGRVRNRNLPKPKSLLSNQKLHLLDQKFHLAPTNKTNKSHLRMIQVNRVKRPSSRFPNISAVSFLQRQSRPPTNLPNRRKTENRRLPIRLMRNQNLPNQKSYLRNQKIHLQVNRMKRSNSRFLDTSAAFYLQIQSHPAMKNLQNRPKKLKSLQRMRS